MSAAALLFSGDSGVLLELYSICVVLGQREICLQNEAVAVTL